jgi:hypothetical protein
VHKIGSSKIQRFNLRINEQNRPGQSIYCARVSFIHSPAGEQYQWKMRTAFLLFPTGDLLIIYECPTGNKAGVLIFCSIDMNALTGNAQNHAVRSIYY